jgi:hypothetical protein
VNGVTGSAVYGSWVGYSTWSTSGQEIPKSHTRVAFGAVLANLVCIGTGSMDRVGVLIDSCLQKFRGIVARNAALSAILAINTI